MRLSINVKRITFIKNKARAKIVFNKSVVILRD